MQAWLAVDLIAACLLAGLAIFVTRRRAPTPLWPPLLALFLFALLYVLGDAITFVAADPLVEQLGIAVLYSGGIPLLATTWLVAVRYAQVRGRPFAFERRAWVRAPVVFAVVGWLVMMTNPIHGRFLTPVIGGRNEYEWAWWAVMAVGYAFLLGSTAVFAWLIVVERSRSERLNAAVMVTAFGVSAASHFAYVLAPRPPDFDATVVGVSLMCLLSLAAIYRTHLFFLLPVALSELIRRDPDGVVLTDRQGRIRYANPAARALLGEEAGAPDADAPELLAACLSPAEGTGEGPGAWVARLGTADAPRVERAVFRFGPGRARWLAIDAAPILTDRGAVAAVSLRLEEVTETRRAAQERRRFEERMQHAQRLESLGVLAGGIAHDFNNLLTAVLGSSDLALEDLPPGSRARREIEEAMRAAGRGAEIVHQMLVYAGKARSALRPIDLSQVVDEMRQLLGAVVSKAVRFELHLDPALPSVEADPAQVRQLVMNLITNAAEALEGREGRIELATGVRDVGAEELAPAVVGAERPPGRKVFLRVRDDGCGIEEGLLARIFEPFYTTKFAGRGLGLAAVLGIVRAHAGTLLIDSRPDRGSSFTVLLPLSERAREVCAAVPTRVEVEHARGTVLVVEDEDAVRRVLRRFLESAGLSVLEAAEGDAALAALARAPEDLALVVLDATMPGPGIERVLRGARDTLPGTPVLVVSGFAREMALPESSRDLASAFLKKPFTREQLLAEVRKLMEEKPR